MGVTVAWRETWGARGFVCRPGGWARVGSGVVRGSNRFQNGGGGGDGAI